MRRRTPGFTLIELLVTIAIIAILIGILLPTFKIVQRQARVAKCSANVRSHLVASAAYSSANKSYVPNAPANATGGANPETDGIRGLPSPVIATPDRPLNGWAFPEGVRTLDQIIPDGDRLLSDLHDSSIFELYFMVLGPYMLEGEGMQMLQEALLSPSHRSRYQNWDEWREYNQTTNGNQFSIQSPNPQSSAFRVGSYRYTLSGVLDPLYLTPTDLTGPRPRYGPRGLDALDVPTQQIRADQLRYNSTANISYPDQKVLFWLFHAYHDFTDPGENEFPNSGLLSYSSSRFVPTGTADGSVRVGNEVTRVPSNAFEGSGGIGVPYIVSINGLRGRDIQ